MRQYIPLIALVGLFLVPYGWLAEISPDLDFLFNVVFHSQIAHIVGHGLIFALIGAAALRRFPDLRARPALYLGLILLVALAQEALQMPFKGGLHLADTLSDIGVDLVAAATILFVMYRYGGIATVSIHNSLSAVGEERKR